MNKKLPPRPPFCEDKNPLLGLMNLEGVSLADALTEYLWEFQQGALSGRFPPLPPLEVWLSFYRNQKTYFIVLCSKMLPHLIEESILLRKMHHLGAPFIRHIFLLFRFLKRWVQNQFRKRLERELTADRLHEWARQDLQAQLKAVSNTSQIEPNTAESREQARRGLSIPELQFMLLVVVPCLVHYRQMPQALFRQAMEGDIEAVGQLARLDASILNDVRIMEHVRFLSLRDPRRYNLTLGKAINTPLPVLDKGEIKNAIASLLILMTEQIPLKEMKNTPSTIKEAFNSVEQIRSGDRFAYDPNIHQDPDNFRQTMHRDKKRWKKLF